MIVPMSEWSAAAKGFAAFLMSQISGYTVWFIGLWGAECKPPPGEDLGIPLRQSSSSDAAPADWTCTNVLGMSGDAIGHTAVEPVGLVLFVLGGFLALVVGFATAGKSE